MASGRKPDLGVHGRRARAGRCAAWSSSAEAMAVIPLVKRALPEARLPMQDAKTLGAMGAAALAGQAVRRVGALGRRARGGRGRDQPRARR